MPPLYHDQPSWVETTWAGAGSLSTYGAGAWGCAGHQGPPGLMELSREPPKVMSMP